ncbi:ribosome hibernation-promoting factor, HPF/YfiA family [Membranihabitans maritimus]|uniref:ribosome hibernation-promoting factor, HPF/YfiA family n=1 Tax=Membranihabitans maritimus TaxID=2904244 RepID=UPI001F00D11D|nr:ribosome-associated translation inhibitor RaiA [Membranihabitans maritimus]
MRVRVESVHFTADTELVNFIERKMQKLEQFFDQIIDVEIFLKLENSGQVRDKVFEGKIHVPGDTIFVKEVDKTFESATDKAVDVLKRQIIKHKEMQRAY